MQKAVAKKQTGISKQEERMEEAPAREDTEGGSAVKSTGKNPLKEITGKSPKREKANMQKAPAKKQTGISQQKSACKKTA